eukprot:12356701-Heterocapsa_arctica.AAC.1
MTPNNYKLTGNLFFTTAFTTTGHAARPYEFMARVRGYPAGTLRTATYAKLPRNQGQRTTYAKLLRKHGQGWATYARL